MTEDDSAKVEDGWADSDLTERAKAALTITDAALVPRPLEDDERRMVDLVLSPAEQAEAAFAAGIFDGFARSIVIGLGLEPESMRTRVVPAPFSS